MRTVITVLTVFFISYQSYSQSARSYEVIENRFTKNILDHNDSLAFEKLAESKLILLMDYTRLYYTDRGRKTRAHIRERISELFASPVDSIEEEPIDPYHFVKHMNKILDTLSIPDQYKYIKWQRGKEHLGTLYLGDNQFVVKVFLKKTTKAFGNNRSEVWQLFLFDPQFDLKEED